MVDRLLLPASVGLFTRMCSAALLCAYNIVLAIQLVHDTFAIGTSRINFSQLQAPHAACMM
jgi:hypothetical protein